MDQVLCTKSVPCINFICKLKGLKDLVREAGLARRCIGDIILLKGMQLTCLWETQNLPQSGISYV